MLATDRNGSKVPATMRKVRIGARGRRKVKSGCQTCKIRHKKCDEVRPACTPCLAYGHHCDFSALSRQDLSVSSRKRSHQGITQMTHLRLPRHLSWLPDYMLSLTSFEAMLLDYFRHVCIEDMMLVFEDMTLCWEAFVIQAIHTEPYIYHGAMAVSALTRNNYCPARDQTGSSEHHCLFQYALLQYDRAAQALNAHLKTGIKGNAELAILCALMFMNIESFQGCENMMQTHLSGAFAVLEQQSKLSNDGEPRHLEPALCQMRDQILQSAQVVDDLTKPARGALVLENLANRKDTNGVVLNLQLAASAIIYAADAVRLCTDLEGMQAIRQGSDWRVVDLPRDAMWLLNTHTIELEEFSGRDVPPYAVLSHTWNEDNEVSFDELQSGLGRGKEGYAKIKGCCELAASQKYDYCWIDTCCIDKRSSAELSEAINSMFAWYKGSWVCYVYLSDVPTWDSDDLAQSVSDLMYSRWFKRGWTLQELIAPDYVVFYAKDWSIIGTRSSLHLFLQGITGIPAPLLTHDESLDSYNVATRMSWAAGRETTRPEDIAYCLFGIFDVHLPLLYGEGQRAFLRLQEEILKKTEDHSILAWARDDEHEKWGESTPISQPCGFFASSPCAFRSFEPGQVLPSETTFPCIKNLVQLMSMVGYADPLVSLYRDIDPPLSTPRGLKMKLLRSNGQTKGALILIQCFVPDTIGYYDLAIQAISEDGVSYVRASAGREALKWIDSEDATNYVFETLYLRPSTPPSNHVHKKSIVAITMDSFTEHHLGFEILQTNNSPEFDDLRLGYDYKRMLSVPRGGPAVVEIKAVDLDCHIIIKIVYRPPRCDFTIETIAEPDLPLSPTEDVIPGSPTSSRKADKPERRDRTSVKLHRKAYDGLDQTITVTAKMSRLSSGERDPNITTNAFRLDISASRVVEPSSLPPNNAEEIEVVIPEPQPPGQMVTMDTVNKTFVRRRKSEPEMSQALVFLVQSAHSEPRKVGLGVSASSESGTVLPSRLIAG